MRWIVGGLFGRVVLTAGHYSVGSVYLVTQMVVLGVRAHREAAKRSRE